MGYSWIYVDAGLDSVTMSDIEALFKLKSLYSPQVPQFLLEQQSLIPKRVSSGDKKMCWREICQVSLR